jgi:hypothetical protein
MKPNHPRSSQGNIYIYIYIYIYIEGGKGLQGPVEVQPIMIEAL